MKKKRIVVKIGSSSLTNKNGGLCLEKLQEHVEALARLKELGHDVILISSGAVAAGFTDLGYTTRPVSIVGKQAAAAVGQGQLLHAYSQEFKKHEIVSAQLLLTKQNLLAKDLYQNATATLTELLKRNVLPIINENDSVSVDGLTFGDNDMLSALVSGLVQAQMLIILTDVNGIYRDDPRVNPEAGRYNFLSEIPDELIKATSSEGSLVGTGGMKSKVEAAQTALALGSQIFIGTGSGSEKLVQILEGNGDGTYIGDDPQATVKNSKQWLALHSMPTGKIEVDDGAALAISAQGRSLLPVGITKIGGRFKADDVVEVLNPAGEVIGRGQVNFSSEDLAEIKGLCSEEARVITKTGKRQVVIHRDQWFSATRKEQL
ncbi:glutamate 5-kinase [Planococcus sp. NCCP-2050]|uniref:glutamate 5-kinase n=1 Tax=Planococcus sp. NCCP-2050 TaxID=2944679 RepID=UPI00203FAE38|nr:glutamate 5-kinase [Planococcus sp. NCCP-2050]GKW46082.1 glutamate 5-kinase [Planococcus sp. NCCP-2050]